MSSTTATQSATQIVTLPSKKVLGVRRNNVSLVDADFPKWMKEATAILSEVLGKDNTKCNVTSFPRFGSLKDVDVEHLIYLNNSDESSELVEKVEKFKPTSGLIVKISEIPSGDYAYCRHVGSYDDLSKVWNKLGSEKFEEYTLANEPCWEEYINDCSQVPKEELITDIYWKLNKK